MADTAKIRNMFGQTVYAYKNDCLTDSIVSNGLYDILNNYLITAILAGLDEPVVLDIGANIGNHAMVISLFSGQVFCFEPQHETFKLLMKNIGENNLLNIRAFNFGLSSINRDNVVMVLQNNNNGASSVIDGKPELTDNKPQQIDTVQLKKGDEIINELSPGKIDFIKIDVEGFEFDVLKGLEETIIKHRPVIIAEWKNELVRKKFKGSPLDILPENYSILVFKKNIEYNLLFRSQRLKLAEKFNLLEDNDLVFVPGEKKGIVLKSVNDFFVRCDYFKLFFDLIKGIHQSRYLNDKIKTSLLANYNKVVSCHNNNNKQV